MLLSVIILRQSELTNFRDERADEHDEAVVKALRDERKSAEKNSGKKKGKDDDDEGDD